MQDSVKSARLQDRVIGSTVAARDATRQTTALRQRDGDGVKIGGGLLGLLILIADVWAIVNIFQSPASTGSKVLWTVLVWCCPCWG
jgi:hypothetical protein